MVYVTVTFTSSSKNLTVCRGHNLTIECSGHRSTTSVVTWTINGTLYSESAAVNNPLYQRSNPTDSLLYSLKVFSMNHTTTFQCILYLCSTTGATVFRGTNKITVTTGTYVHSHVYTVATVCT